MANIDVSQKLGIQVVLPIITPLVAYNPVLIPTGGTISGQTSQSSWSQDVYFMDLEISFTGATTTGTITALAIQLPINPLNGNPYTIGGPVGSRFMGGGIDALNLVANRSDGTIQGLQGDTYVSLNLDSGNSYSAAGSSRSCRASIRIPIAEFISQGGFQAYNSGVSPTSPSLVKEGYDSGSFVSAYSGPFVSTNFTIEWVRVGKQVTLNLPSVSVTATTSSILQIGLTNMPASLRPAVSKDFITRNINSAADVVGITRIPATGDAAAYASVTSGSFTSGAAAGMESTSITYRTP